MHLAFIDIAVAYAADRPEQDAPLGGTTSAVCFLSRELVKAGIACTLFNKIQKPETAHGVRAMPLESLIEERSNTDYTAFIFCGRWVEWLVNLVSEGGTAPVIAWMHESSFNPELVPALNTFHAVAFVSEWQKRINQPHMKPHWQQTVLRNAMNPRAVNLFQTGELILAAKSNPPVLLYAGATPRGAFHIPAVLDHLRPKTSNFTAEIYCDCSPSRDPQSNEHYINWIRGLPNVAHVGMVGQTKLLEQMKRASFLISPNTWPETSCIALIEAMAAGLSVITTNRAVLPETAAGYARHVVVDDIDHPTRFDIPLPYEVFAEAVSSAMKEWNEDLEKTERRLQKQVAYFREHYQWHQRVQPWVEFVRSLSAT
ncbi:MAG: glycosyltransferase [Alphaproteobacteria bacterium]|nr:glycosyltransferase [Alphaproteobacteria bacterium]